MSIVIVGGNERMAGQYVDICKEYGCKAKVFTKEKGSLRKKMGCPDLLILFTSTVSHKMVISASQEAKKKSDSCRPRAYKQCFGAPYDFIEALSAGLMPDILFRKVYVSVCMIFLCNNLHQSYENKRWRKR